MDKFNIGITGADTRIGASLLRLLLAHPVVDVVAVSSERKAGTAVSDALPSLRGLCDMRLVSERQALEQADVILNADLSIDSQELAAGCVKNKCVFIDVSPAFRLESDEEYRSWYGDSFTYAGLHEAAVYGLPEITRSLMPGKVLVGVAGTAATAALLALCPLLEEELISADDIMIYAQLPDFYFAEGGFVLPEMSGRSVFPSASLAETAEIEQALGVAAKKPVRVTAVPCRERSGRAAVVTCFAKARLSANDKTLRSCLSARYAEERFVRVLPSGTVLMTESVIGSNFCDIMVSADERTGTVVVSAALDGLIKGSAGQAVQCMNAILSMPEYLSLEQLPIM